LYSFGFLCAFANKHHERRPMVDPYTRLSFHEFLLTLIRALSAIALHSLPVAR
jgi:hypothetical protein